MPFVQALLIVFVAIVLIAGFFIAFNVGQVLGPKEKTTGGTPSDMNVGTGTPSLQFIHLVDSSCAECFDLNAFIESFKEMAGISTKSVEFDSDEAKALIQKYNITKIPTIIISGDTSKVTNLIESWPSFGSIEDNNVLVARNVPPVYLDLTENKLKGLVELITLTINSCTDCEKPITPEQLNSVGITVSNEASFDYSTNEGKALAVLYDINRLPASIMSSDLQDYPEEVLKGMLSFGGFAPDGKYILRKPFPPYFDLISNKAVGWVNLTNLTDASCASCYDVNEHKQILEQSFGVKIKEEKTIDINSSEGKKLLSDYNITKIPTVILTGNINAYDLLLEAWAAVGSTEADGSMVFRQVEQVGTYFDLNANKLVEVQSTGASNAGQ